MTDSTDPFEAEARERWGDTPSYRESARRTAAYREVDWVELTAERDAIEADFAAAMLAGLPAASPTSRLLSERHRRHIDRWFYPCSHEMQYSLAEMYISDERFTRHYDDIAPGLAQYVHDAIAANSNADA